MNVLITGLPPNGANWNGWAWPVGAVIQIPEQFYCSYFMSRVGTYFPPPPAPQTRITWQQFTGGGGQAVNDE